MDIIGRLRRNRGMSTKVENLENNMVKLTIEVEPDRFEEGMKHAYNINKSKIALPGFRKGKAPRKMIEKIYGPEVFYEDAVNHLIPDAYDEAVKESELDIVSRPDIEVVEVEAGKPLIFTATAAVKPEVTLGEYHGVEVEKQEIEVTEENIQKELEKAAEKNARMITITDRPIEKDDEVTIDFEGFIDGEAFEGGKGEDYPLTIGSHSFIDTFEDQLIGKSIDEELEVNVTFPEDYQQTELAGKPALFKVKIKGIKKKEFPVLDDEFAKDVSEFDTLEEYKKDIEQKLHTQEENAAKEKKQEQVLEKVAENAVVDIPEPMIEMQTDRMVNDMAQRMQYQGLNLEQYFQYTGQNIQSMKASMKPEAEKRVRNRLVLEAIVKAENIEVSDEEVNEEIKKMAEMYNMEVDKLTESVGENEKESIKEDLKNQKAFDFIVDHAKEV